MIVSRTPYRLSFFGGGTDLPAWYAQHSGAVLATTIDKYCYITLRYLPPFFEHRFRVVWSKIETCQQISEISHPAVRAVFEYLRPDHGFELHHVGDLPARSGMGSSSSFTVGLLNAAHAMKGQLINKQDLALESIHLEQNILREAVGSQDQVSAAYGGFNRIDFHTSGEITVTPMTLSPLRLSELNAHLLLFYTGIVRTSSQVQTKLMHDLEGKKQQLHLMKRLVDESIALLNSSADISAFGHLLHKAWQAKRSLSNVVTNPEIDAIYNTALEAGAIGGKLAGAGGGGFLLLFAAPEKHKALRKALNNLINVPFNFESSGSQIIFASRDQDYPEVEKLRARQQITPFHELRPADPAAKLAEPFDEAL